MHSEIKKEKMVFLTGITLFFETVIECYSVKGNFLLNTLTEVPKINTRVPQYPEKIKVIHVGSFTQVT